MKQFLLAFTLLTITLNFSFAQCDGRYQDEIFPDVTKAPNIIYGENYDENNSLIDLVMDVYTPDGDTSTERPVVILAHGGSFVGGSKSEFDVVQVCNYLAKRGYVTASIDYRLTDQNNLYTNPDDMIKAVMRAVQDGKAAIRFFRKDASNGNTYGVDPTGIYVGGSSAGAILAYHLAYMTDTTEMLQKWRDFVVELGGIEGSSGNPGYSSQPTAVFGYAGAIGDTNWLKSNSIPFMAMHAKSDGTVPYNGGFPLGLPTLPKLYGSNSMNVRAENMDIANDYYSYTGSKHPPHAAGQIVLDSTKSYTADFLYKYLPCKTVSIIENERPVNILFYPNPVSNRLSIVNNEQKPIKVSLFNILGQQAFTLNNVNTGTTNINVSELNKGIYWIIFEDALNHKVISTSKVIIR